MQVPDESYLRSGLVKHGRRSVKVVVRSFKKCGISVAIDGSEDGEIHIDGLEDYVMEDSDSEDDYTDEEDPFADCTEDV